ncbi:MAG: carboxypeptidase regulatory-like domain-containing protein, partial [Prochlorococcus sp.]|nr:carboxypeptidase regulatory-like domain-containing protein [Prochlorococcus sp.]
TDFAPTFGTYCYTVTPVYQEGNGTPAGPECIDWLIPALCWTPTALENWQWPDVEEDVMLTLENCGDGMLDFTFPDYVSGKGFSCTMEVCLMDSYGDGWNGGTLSVFVNGNIVLDNITLASGYGPECFGFPVDNGDDISTVYTPGGWSYENSYDFLDGDGNVIYSAGNVSLPVGVVYGTCPQPSYIVDVEPAAGQIPAGGTLDVMVTYSSAGFPAGSYDEWLNIETNDPARLSDSVFNTMHVYLPGSIFGQVTDCNTGIGMGGVTVRAEGVFGPIYYATTDGSGQYMMYADADEYGVSFEKLGFENEFGVAIVTSGNATELNASMCETPYPVQWVFADPNQDDTQCEVTWTLPMGPYV